MEYITNITVRYAETDKMGVVHHSVYAIWYEEARTNFIKSLGISYSQIESLGIMLPLADLSSKYIKPVFYEDLLSIHTKIKTLTSVKIQFEYKIFNKDNILINTGITTHPFVNSDFKLINLKKHNPEIYNLLSCV